MVAGSALWAMQQAVLTTLSTDVTLTGMLGVTSGIKGVFDEVPENAAFPYVVVDDQSTEKFSDSFTKQRTEGLFTLDIWSRALGWQEALTIYDRCNALLHKATLTLPGGVWTLSGIRFDNMIQVRDPDGVSRRIQVRYQFWAEEI